MYLNFTPVPRAILTGTEPRYRVEDLEDFLIPILTGCRIAAECAVLAEGFGDEPEEVHAELKASHH